MCICDVKLFESKTDSVIYYLHIISQKSLMSQPFLILLSELGFPGFGFLEAPSF